MKTSKIFRNIAKLAKQIDRAKAEAKSTVSNIKDERGVLDALEVEANAILKL